MKTKNSRKFLSLIMALTMIMTLLGGMTISASAFNGAGTVTSPYLIASAADLQQLSMDVNNGKDFNGEYFRLTDDLDLSAVSSWKPIGNSANPFDGFFDGNGKTISNITISVAGHNVGLFGSVGDNSVIENLKVYKAVVFGWQSVGAVVGRSFGTVENCQVSDSIIESDGRGQGVGGVVGGSWNDGVVSNLTATRVYVLGTQSTAYAGGVVGKIEGTASNLQTVGESTITGMDYAGSVIGYVSAGATYSGLSIDESDGPVTVTADSSEGYVGFDANIPPITGDTTITTGGSYNVQDDAVITITTNAPVTLVGDTGTYAITINCTHASGADLTLEDLSIVSPASNSSNIVNFTAGVNTLTLEGENLMENNRVADSKAVIRVAPSAALTIEGPGTLYLYKNAMGTGIGSDTNEANGDITFNGGNIFMKGSRTGAVIGNDAGSSFNQNDLGVITINSGNLYVTNVANGAAIGGSNQSKNGTVIMNGGNLTITTAFAGSAIGAGNGQKNNAGANGTLIVNGGSIKAMITDNAYGSWGVTGPNPGYIVSDAAITADMVDRNGNPIYLYLAPGTQTDNVVAVDGEPFFTGDAHQYYYTPSTTVTKNNWSLLSPPDNNLYLYLSGEDHLISVNSSYSTLEWDGGTSTFTPTALAKYTVGTGGTYATLVAARTAIGSNAGVIELLETVVASSDTIDLDADQYIARAPSFTSGAMFDVGTGTTLALESGTIAGGWSCVAVNVDGGTFTIAPAPSATFKVTGIVYLANGSYISVGSTIASITGQLTVEMANSAIGQIAGQRIGTYTFSTNDLAKFAYFDGTHTFQRANANQRITIAS